MRRLLIAFLIFIVTSCAVSEYNISADINDQTKITNAITKSTLYTYHNYSTLVSDMQNLNSTYPNIFELYTAQDMFGLPDVTSGGETYKTWIIRITNESSGFNKSEVLFIGGHHGDETVGVEAAYYFAELLTERYGTDHYIRYLVDNREIYIMPVVNPYGWVHLQRYDEQDYDMNRDYPYDFDYSGSSSGSTEILATIGARAVHELSKRHLFINTVSWHGGAECIVYAWGSYAHNTEPYESPDDVAFYNQGKYMSEYGGPYTQTGSSYYPWGRANDWYPCYGAYEDYAYAASWDTVNEDPSYPTNGCRSLTHCVEISNTKNPAENTLGGGADIYTPGGTEDGYVPKNIRIALVLTDIAQPYINITGDIPSEALPGQNITFEWEVCGALNTTETNIQYGLDPDPVDIYSSTTQVLSGGTKWQNVLYSQNITMPSESGDYYFVIRAKVDNDTLNQTTPEPDIEPQSLYVNMRTNGSWSITNGENSMEGHVNWYSEVIHIKVKSTSKTFDLLPGWDLITLPFSTEHTAESLAQNITNCTHVSKWNASLQELETHEKGSVENDFAIEDGVGYFVCLTDNSNFTVTGIDIPNVITALKIGWNSIGWFNETGITASELGQRIENCTAISYWNNTLGRFITHSVGTSVSDFAVNRGGGYFIFVLSESIWLSD